MCHTFSLLKKCAQCTFKCTKYKKYDILSQFCSHFDSGSFLFGCIFHSHPTEFWVRLKITKFTSFHKANGFVVKVTIMNFKHSHTNECAAFGCDGESWCTQKKMRTKALTCVKWVKGYFHMHLQHFRIFTLLRIHWSRMIKCVRFFWPKSFHFNAFT